MKKSECEAAIRSLIGQWASEKGYRQEAHESPSFSEFWSWMSDNGYGGYKQFRSTAGPLYDAEMWFDEEMNQTWRN